tara:strand:+ start:1140 stop:1505 length:366 start_codon:yes stop_codon:yes gene_type:complete
MTSRSDSTSTRLDEMREQVSVFHSEHPEIWSLFVRFTMDRIGKGFANYSAKAIFERIRWEVDSVGADGKLEFKLNNNWPSFYARRFMKMYPKYRGFFRTRRQTSQEDYPTKMSPLTPRDYQ